MRIKQVYRYARPYRREPREIDGLPNFFHFASSPGEKLALLDSGINPIESVQALDGVRVPAILIRSSPHKTGAVETPWQDVFDSDRGHIRYFGDNKFFHEQKSPEESPGNKALLHQFQMHKGPTPEQRAQAAPLLCFRGARIGNRTKGNVVFEGVAAIEKIQLVSQFDARNESSFPNYVYDLLVFDLSPNDEQVDWRWIEDRRNPEKDSEATLKFAPKTWRKWVKDGETSLESNRRNVFKLLTETSMSQKLTSTSDINVLKEIYEFYSGRKTRFEALASYVTAKILRESVGYQEGWITSASADGGADFIGRVDIGSGLAGTKIVVLGQAKCERIDTPTGGNHIARTVARLKRGWIGVYVTTSYFSESVQREVIEDQYPILLINGKKLVETVNRETFETGESIKEFLMRIDAGYPSQLSSKRPEEILFD